MAIGPGEVYLDKHSNEAEDTPLQLNGAKATTCPDTDTVSVFGRRIGCWFERLPRLAIALDGSVAELDFDDINIGAGALTPPLPMRLSLMPGDLFPRGRLQPYVGIGPAFYF